MDFLIVLAFLCQPGDKVERQQCLKYYESCVPLKTKGLYFVPADVLKCIKERKND